MKNLYSKKLIFVFAILISFIFMMYANGPTIAGASGKKPVKIGLLTPLSLPGDPASGKRHQWGAEVGIQFVNEEMGGVLGGRPVELVVEDDAGTPSEGIAGFRKLVQKDGVVAVVGQHHSSVCLAVNEVANDLGIPLFTGTASSAKITATHYPTVFSNVPIVSDRAALAVSFMKEMGWKRIAVLTEDTDYGTDWADSVKKCATDDMEVKVIVFPRTMTDFTPALLEINAWKPDILINVGVAASAYLIVKQSYDIGLFPKVPMQGSYNFPVRKEYWDAVGDKGKYILFEGYYKPGMFVSWMGEWLISRYKKLHNEDLTIRPLNAFGHVAIIAQAMNLAQSDNPKDIVKALTKWPFMFWSGVIKYEDAPGPKWHHVSPPYLIFQQTKVGATLGESKLVWPAKLGGDGKVEMP